jgi:hypothetical protein
MHVLDTLRADNLGRDPELLALKYQKMAASPFVFVQFPTIAGDAHRVALRRHAHRELRQLQRRQPAGVF